MKSFFHLHFFKDFVKFLATFDDARRSMLTRLDHNDTDSANEDAKRRRITNNQQRRANNSGNSQKYNMNKTFDQEKPSIQVKIYHEKKNVIQNSTFF